MSFAAVTGLIAVAEWEQARQRRAPHGHFYRYLRGIALTSLVGSLATMPFALFTFGRAGHYAVLGNLLAMPVMGFWVMPAAAISVAAMPLGLETMPLHLMGWGIDVMLAMGRFVSGLPEAVTLARAFPVGALALMALGGLWLAIWRRTWRWWGIAPVLAGFAWAMMAPVPDILIAADARTVAYRASDEQLYFPRPPADAFSASRWLERDGDDRDFHAAVGGGRCDAESCVISGPDGITALPFRREAVSEDCAHAAILISAVPVRRRAAAKAGVWIRDTIAIGGGSMPSSMSVRHYSVRAWRGERPWVTPAFEQGGAPDQSDNGFALHLHPVGTIQPCLIGRVGGFQGNGVAAAAQALQGRSHYRPPAPPRSRRCWRSPLPG